jgi:2-amino-4-hydroxy-6-hydroxymethyldihydropteridine diphosphokinase
MNRVVIGIGSNIHPRKHIKLAREMIKTSHRIISESRFIETDPIGFKEQNRFINGVIFIETNMNQTSLENWLKNVEEELGRVRTSNKYGPRTIDLDIVVWNGNITDADFFRRDFLKTAVLEVIPNLAIKKQNSNDKT